MNTIIKNYTHVIKGMCIRISIRSIAQTNLTYLSVILKYRGLQLNDIHILYTVFNICTVYIWVADNFLSRLE